MDAGKLKEIVRLHGMWLRSEEGGVRADLIGANLRDADMRDASLRDADLRDANLRNADLRDASLRGADLSQTYSDILHASVSWTDHGECGRRLLAVYQPARGDQPEWTRYFCGCFAGTEEELRKYIADGDESHRASRTLAVDFCSARIAEMRAKRAGGVK